MTSAKLAVSASSIKYTMYDNGNCGNAWAGSNDSYFHSTNHGDGSWAQMRMDFTVYTRTTISWQYWVYSESASYDWLRFYVYKNGANIGEYGNYGGHYGNWANFSLTLDPGNYNIYFRYRKDGSVSHHPDEARVRNISIVNGLDTIQGGTNIGNDEPETMMIPTTQEDGAGEGEIYNPVFYERIPLDYLKQAAPESYGLTGRVGEGSDIDAAYLENVLNSR